MAQYQRPSDRSAFEIAILCALPSEADPVLALFDEHWEDTYSYGKAPGDPNAYATGRIGRHNVVLVFMPGMGKAHAASVAASFRSSFRKIKLCLLIGICGGVPGGTQGQEEILLGDVIISTGIIQYDFGRQLSSQVVRKNTLHDEIGRPGPEIRGALNKLMGVMGREQLQKSIMIHLKQLSLQPLDHLSYPGLSEDNLFEPDYSHKHRDIASCMVCFPNSALDGPVCDAALKLSCADLGCDPNRLVRRKRHEQVSDGNTAGPSSTYTLSDWPQPIVHLGLIASGDLVMKTARRRDAIAKEEKVIAFEMEGAGVWDQFPTIVMKGVCDYADSHKNKKWQKYAASTAAACAKAFLTEWRTEDSSQQSIYNNEDNMTERTLSRRNTDHVPQFSLAQSSELFFSSDSNVVSLEEKRKSYLESLSFNQINARQLDIKSALARTCTWLLHTPEYLRWLDYSFLPDHHGFLWIKGKPAAGKSTIMKFVLQNVGKSMPESTIISFFFNARGDSLEKSTVGMYRTLLFELLQKVPSLLPLLDKLRSTGSDESSHTHKWDIQTLQSLFEQAIEQLDNKCLICLIDALDECPQDQIREMIRFLECLGQAATAATSKCRLLICFSSRHYPHITIGNSVQLVLEGQENHQQDITKYINSELKAGRSKLIERIKGEILERASGIFLWVVLVVQILNKEYDGGRLHALHKRLKEIPDGLDELFKSVLTRDGENMAELILCIRWILHARQPLKCEELYYAILVGLDPDVVDKFNPDEIELGDMERFILSSSKGLAEVTKGRNRRVQFIHESVRDFLLKKNGLDKLQQDLGDNFPGTSHEILKQCCQNYMHASVSDSPLSSGELESFSKDFPFLEYAVMNVLWHADAARGLGIEQTDFLKGFFTQSLWISRRNFFGRYKKGRAYTSKASLLYIYTCEKLLHLMRDEIKQVPYIDIQGEHYGFPLYAALFYKDEQALDALLEPAPIPLRGSSTFNECVPSLTEHVRRTVILKVLHDSVGKKYDRNRTLLSYAAESGDSDLIKVLLSTGKVNVNAADKETGRTPLIWAAARGHHDVVKLLIIVAGVDVNFYGNDQQTALTAAVSVRSIETVQVLLSSTAVDPNQPLHRLPLTSAALKGHKEMVRLLLEDRRVQLELKNLETSYRQPLWAAALCAPVNAREVVQMMLDTGKVNPEMKDEQGCTLFSVVVQGIHSDSRHPGKTQSLKDRTSDTKTFLALHEQYDEDDHMMMVPKGTSKSLPVIQLSADLDFVVGDQANRAELVQEEEMDELLGRETFADGSINVEDQVSACSTPEFGAYAAQFSVHRELADILLRTGRVNPNARSDSGYTALYCAVLADNRAAVHYLLSLDQVDPNLGDHSDQTPLHTAITCRNHWMVRRLLACDQISLSVKHRTGLNPVLLAACRGFDFAVNMLIDTGRIDLDAREEQDCLTPIWVAAAAGFEQTVRLLSGKPVSRSIPKGQENVVLFSRVMDHIAGRGIHQELASGDSKLFDRSDLIGYQVQLAKLGRVNEIPFEIWGLEQDNSRVEVIGSLPIEKYLSMREFKRQMKSIGLQENYHDTLSDYQMQLILLEQQNKKRLMLARQEQHSATASVAVNTPEKHFTELSSPILHRKSSTRGSIEEERSSGPSTSALSDFQMQLMLLERQKKKRRMLALQEEASRKRREITFLK